MFDFAALTQQLQQIFPLAGVEVVPNEAVPGQSSLKVAASAAREVAQYLKSTEDLQFDYLSNVTGVDWLDATLKEKRKVKKVVEEKEVEVEEVTETFRPGYLEVVYHLYSMALRHGPLILRLRTTNRTDQVTLPSFVSIWRSAELQEREIFDLYGVQFDGHPDLRRLLMWDEFQDHPMRKDYVEPDDYEFEPTPHDDVLVKTKPHYETFRGTEARRTGEGAT